MSEPIIIRTPAPDTEERLVLVPLLAVTVTPGGDDCLTVRSAAARDATPADLLRAGYVPREVPSAEAWKAAHAEAERELKKAEARVRDVSRADPRMRGRLVSVMLDECEDLEALEQAHDAHMKSREGLSLATQMAKLTTRVATLAAALETERGLTEKQRARAEKAERELRDMSERAGDAERERDEVKELARVLEVERDAALDARNACAAERNEARAEVERLTAPGEGSLDNGGLVAAITRGGSYRAEDFDVLDLQAAYRLGVAHERARDAAFVRQHGHRDRATDEELLALAADAFQHRAHGGPVLDDLHKLARAVAARVRKERCLVAQAVGMMPGVRSLTIWHEGPGADTVGVRVNDRKAVMQAPADVPATLARLLGEVSR